ncbi:hypothetical protein CC86DRAFT_213885 [Ophiobolus disseminans]|uniref:Uncharacterized protein n=1 Tax=Ophiobolus disseminans TaxID=1469910 RepID=A0A6A7A464_9PLEO|nr:hypothetical protein CC86DRAFT_213885 [Ophiobolus disseminans]
MDTLPIELLDEVVSHLVASTPSETTTTQHRQQHADISNVRLTSQNFAAAASRHFVTIVQAHMWMLNLGSLNRLANLLLNVHIAKHTTHLHFNVYRFAFDDVQIDSLYEDRVNARFNQHMDMRNTYIQNKLSGQLTKIFQRAKSLRDLELICVARGNDSRYQDAIRFDEEGRRNRRASLRRGYESSYTTFVVDPLPYVHVALTASGANERLQAFTLSRRPEYYSYDTPPVSTDFLTYPKITRLTVDPSYFKDEAMRLHCPQLKHLSVLHFEDMGALVLKMQHERIEPSPETLPAYKMFAGLTSVTITGNPQLFHWLKERPSEVVHVSDLYSFIANIARYAPGLELQCLTIRQATIRDDEKVYIDSNHAPADDAGDRPNDIRHFKGLKIKELKLEGVHWAKKWGEVVHLSGNGFKGEEDELFVQQAYTSDLRGGEIMRLLRKHVEKFRIC